MKLCLIPIARKHVLTAQLDRKNF